jgi:subtilase family serine protease
MTPGLHRQEFFMRSQKGLYIARALTVAIGLWAIALACVAITSRPTAAPKSHHFMTPGVHLGWQETPANAQAGAGGPQFGIFTCQLGLSVGQCYDPFQMRHAYGVDSLIGAGFDGIGQTIVIVDAFQSPGLAAQVAYYNTFYSLPATNLTIVAPDGLTPFDPTSSDQVSWADEISLDVEWSHNIAPGANIVLVLSKSDMDSDLLSALKYAVDNNLGDVISMSFGEAETCVGIPPGPALNAAYHAVFAEATQKGITLFASSGDQGAAQPTCDGSSWIKSSSSPASDPLVTAVGATELRAADYCIAGVTVPACDPTTAPAPGTYLSEIAWNEGPLGDFSDEFGSTEATGGGFSTIFGEPPYQEGTAGLHGGKQRAEPDVAYSGAILHGVLVYLDHPGEPVGFFRFGGTSCGSPQWAAITAIMNQKAGGRIGFLNKAIYDIGKHGNQTSFHDITSGDNSALEFDSMNNPVLITGFSAGTGWDATTGFGSPIAPNVVDALIEGVSPGDAQSGVATTSSHGNPSAPGHMHPH